MFRHCHHPLCPKESLAGMDLPRLGVRVCDTEGFAPPAQEIAILYLNPLCTILSAPKNHSPVWTSPAWEFGSVTLRCSYHLLRKSQSHGLLTKPSLGCPDTVIVLSAPEPLAGLDLPRLGVRVCDSNGFASPSQEIFLQSLSLSLSLQSPS